MLRPKFAFRAGALLKVASFAVMLTGLSMPAAALVPNDNDVDANGDPDLVDTNNVWAGVAQMWNRVLNPDGTVSTFVCTGTLINPRTVVLAQHCSVDVPDEGFGPGQGNHMGFSFNPTDSFTGFDVWRRNGNPAPFINDPITGEWKSRPDQLFYNVLQVKSVFNVTEFFPGGDILMASFDTPTIGLPTYGMLFSPLKGPTHAELVAYGSTGIGSLGDVVGLDFKRRAGENMIDGLFSQNDYLAAEFAVPGFGFGSADAAQLLYHIDFDKPGRVKNDCARGPFPGVPSPDNIVCKTPPLPTDDEIITLDGSSVVVPSQEIDWYPGDALRHEAGTAGGDSGSALFADKIFSRPLITGVLSGGWIENVAAPVANGYGDVSYYNPLFLFRDWLVENNPYVYASAKNGNGNWSDTRHWVQNMDPNYFYIDKFGKIRNGLPASEQPGYFADSPKWGTIFDTPASPSPGDTGPDLFLCQLDPSFACPPDAGLSASGRGSASASNLAQNDVGFVGTDPATGGGFGGRHPTGPTASKDGPTGPGSTGFVPNNSYGTYGTWTGAEDGIARFYDVTLNNIGKTTLDMNAEVDSITVSGPLTSLDIKSGKTLNALVEFEQSRGVVNVDGTLNAREYMLWGGILNGKGTITTETLFNVVGLLSASDLGNVGTMTINGDYVQSSHGTMVVNIKRQGNTLTNDFIEVNGGASLDGLAVVTPVNIFSRPKFGDKYTALHADAVIGNFDAVPLILGSPVLFGESVVQANGDVDLFVRARKLSSLVPQDHNSQSLAQALDAIRSGGQSSRIQSVYDVVDYTALDSMKSRLFSLAPVGTWSQMPFAVEYAQDFARDFFTRSEELRSGEQGMSERSLLNAHGFLGDGSSDQGGRPAMGERFGMFFSAQGSLADLRDDYQAPGNLTALNRTGAANLTFGADYRLGPNVAVGIATTMSRYHVRSGEHTPLEHTGYGAMAYMSAWAGNWFSDSYVGSAKHDYSLSRTIYTDSALGAADAAPQASQILAGTRVGYTLADTGGFRFSPTVGLDYARLSLDAYHETGGGEFDLLVDDRALQSVTVATGAEFSFTPTLWTGAPSRFAAYGRFAYAQEVGDGVDRVNARFAAAPDVAFDLAMPLDSSWYSVGLGVSYRLGQRTQLSFDAQSDIARQGVPTTMVTASFHTSF